jgi:8-oxo-dGTP diphosphatase
MERPRVGVGILIIKDGKVLLGKRKASHGIGTWCPPGGHLEFGESMEDCARREVLEETGMKIKNLRFATATNDVFVEDGKHYITLHILAELDSGEPKVVEPDKIDSWEWFPWDNLPEPLFLPMVNLVKLGFRPE